MKKIHSLATLLALSVSLFKKNEDLQVLYATEDGQFFEDKNRALLHADKNELKVQTIFRAIALSQKIKSLMEEDTKRLGNETNTNEGETVKQKNTAGATPHDETNVNEEETIKQENTADTTPVVENMVAKKAPVKKTSKTK